MADPIDPRVTERRRRGVPVAVAQIKTMAHQLPISLYSIFGIVIWGDLGPVTIYRDKQGKLVAFAKTWPHKPASPLQIIQRQRFIDAAAGWQALPATTRAQWETATRRASLCCHGYDLFVHWYLSADDEAVKTLERQTGTTLLAP